MKPTICYWISEARTDTGETTSVFTTRDPFLAMADVLLKGRRPLGRVSRLVKRESLESSYNRVTPSRVTSDRLYLGGVMTTRVASTQEIILHTSIDTVVAPEDAIMGFRSISDDWYLDESYDIALDGVSERLYAWAGGNPQVGQVLLTTTLMDKNHQFWLFNKKSGRKKPELSP